MRSWMILAVLFCLNATAQEANVDQVLSGAEAVNEEELVKAAESLTGQDGKGAEAKPTVNTASVNNNTTGGINDSRPESQIPVFTKTDKAEKSSGTSIWRVVGSIFFIVIAGAGIVFATRRSRTRKNIGGQKARIEVIHQYHMGAKKSLALVRVAGEVMLIGVTDHNINMLKPVALIDDEVEGLLGKDFNHFLEDDFSVQSVQSAIRA